jgi:8-oxo-dGTP pyrophosphatase MutT (NUDIX family)
MWLPVGGHIEPNETPDDAVIREIKEETNLSATLLNIPNYPVIGAVVTHLATPFYVNVHNVGDHNHVGFYYIATTENRDELSIEEREVTKSQWFSKSEIENSSLVTQEVKSLTLRAFDSYTLAR